MAQNKPNPQAAKQAPKPAPVAEPKQELMERAEGSKAVANTEVPDYIKKGAGRGSENVEMADVVIPRIEVAQALSKCLKANDPSYIEDAKQGDLYNTVTREVYGPNVRVVPVFFKKEWLAWREQTLGGGFAGAHSSASDCELAIQQQDKPDEWEATETAQQLVLVVKDDGSTEEAVVSMNKTKLKVSKQWNSLCRLNGNDRFSRMYILHSVDETNSKNQDFKNFGIYNLGFAPRDIYLKGEALYNAITSGARKMHVDASDFESETPAAGGEY